MSYKNEFQKRSIHNPTLLDDLENALPTEYDGPAIARIIAQSNDFESFLTPHKTVFKIPCTEPLEHCALSEDGSTVAYRTGTQFLSIWKRDQQHPLIINTAFAATDRIMMTLSPQGTYLVVFTHNNTNGQSQAHIYNTKTGVKQISFPTIGGYLATCTCNHAETILALGFRGWVAVYDMQGNPLGFKVLPDIIEKVVFSADDSEFAVKLHSWDNFNGTKRKKTVLFNDLTFANPREIIQLTPQDHPGFFITNPYYLEHDGKQTIVQQAHDYELYQAMERSLTLPQALLCTAIVREIQKIEGKNWTSFLGDYHNPYNIKVIVSSEAYAYLIKHIEAMPLDIQENIKRFWGGKSVMQRIQNQLLYSTGKCLAPVDKMLKNNKLRIQVGISSQVVLTASVGALLAIHVITDEIILKLIGLYGVQDSQTFMMVADLVDREFSDTYFAHPVKRTIYFRGIKCIGELAAKYHLSDAGIISLVQTFINYINHNTAEEFLYFVQSWPS